MGWGWVAWVGLKWGVGDGWGGGDRGGGSIGRVARGGVGLG